VLCSKVGRDGSSRWPGRRDYPRHERHRRAHRGAVRRRKATTVIVGRRAAQGDAHAAKLGPNAEFVRADVSVKADVATLITGVAGRHGRLDCLVNCGDHRPVLHEAVLLVVNLCKSNI